MAPAGAAADRAAGRGSAFRASAAHQPAVEPIPSTAPAAWLRLRRPSRCAEIFVLLDAPRSASSGAPASPEPTIASACVTVLVAGRSATARRPGYSPSMRLRRPCSATMPTSSRCRASRLRRREAPGLCSSSEYREVDRLHAAGRHAFGEGGRSPHAWRALGKPTCTSSTRGVERLGPALPFGAVCGQKRGSGALAAGGHRPRA